MSSAMNKNSNQQGKAQNKTETDALRIRGEATAQKPSEHNKQIDWYSQTQKQQEAKKSENHKQIDANPPREAIYQANRKTSDRAPITPPYYGLSKPGNRAAHPTAIPLTKSKEIIVTEPPSAKQIGSSQDTAQLNPKKNRKEQQTVNKQKHRIATHDQGKHEESGQRNARNITARSGNEGEQIQEAPSRETNPYSRYKRQGRVTPETRGQSEQRTDKDNQWKQRKTTETNKEVTGKADVRKQIPFRILNLKTNTEKGRPLLLQSGPGREKKQRIQDVQDEIKDLQE